MMIKPHIAIYIKYSQIIYHSEKNNGNKINKSIFNKNGGRCRDIKTQKACKQGWEVNVGPKIKQNNFHITLHKYSSLYFAL